ncbi:uncharacterized protein LOC115621221 isoform X2 [Scaptodrosophila lebanonensis]|uniref:Uncharacterized protein LOC115621221 isoform X2 n=1 Tax=Drosophila lebanonensis TaxID=7225 RepID=A0A6J2T6W7_DROLE|nr:uncharacterized protein LOC115621221 isoform X2 [Scaptodrosophila lebanonensis]
MMRTDALFSCFLIIFQNVCCQSGSHGVWEDPQAAWLQLAPEEHYHGDQCSQCPAPSVGTTEDALALTYFRKFVNLLLNRKRLHYNEASATYKRSLLFTLLPAQLAELEATHDVRDLDVLLTKIMENVQAAPLFAGEEGCDYAHQGHGVRGLVVDIFKDFLQLLKISEVQFTLFVLLAIVAGWIVQRRFRLRGLTVVIGGIALFGYFHTYLECNRKLEIEQMIDVLEKNNQPTLDNADQSWFARLRNQFVSSGTIEEQQKQQLRKSSKINLAYCRPDHVLLMYLNDLFLKQLEMFLEKVMHTLSNLRSGLSFPYNYVALVSLVALVGYIVKLTFKYILSPKAWAALLHNKNSSRGTDVQQAVLNNEAGGDRLSATAKTTAGRIGRTRAVRTFRSSNVSRC